MCGRLGESTMGRRGAAMILFVCEGNVCRSPLAAGLLRQALGSTSGVTIESAGIHALVGRGVDQGTATIAEKFGLDLAAHRSRQVTPDLLTKSSLVLTATREVRRAVVELHPETVQCAFTVRQLGRILSGASEISLPERAPEEMKVASVCALALRERSSAVALHAQLDDVVDPHRRSLGVHLTAAKQMLPAVSVLSVALGGEPLTWPERGWLSRLGVHVHNWRDG